MFSKFNLELSDEIYNIGDYDKAHYKRIGERKYKEFDSTMKEKLNTFIKDNGIIDGTAMRNEWFNQIKVDVFLSHSHRDIEEVQAFAGWLHVEFGLTAFIDSSVWGYCDDLLNQIDKAYCKNDDENTYNYTMRNYSTSHVHMMLAVSLAKMIDSTECVMFLNTPNSINWKNELTRLKTNNTYKTFSPWIYNELAMTSMLRDKKPYRYQMKKDGKTFFEHSELNIEYQITEFIKKMTKLDLYDLQKWKDDYDSKKKNALDKLYLLKGLVKQDYGDILLG